MRIIVFVFFFIPLIVFLNCSVFLAFLVKKELRRPLNLVHMSLIVELFLVKLFLIIVGLFVYPDIVRFCICPMWFEFFYFSFTIFNIAFINVMLTSLSILQLLFIKGKKWIGWKVVGAIVTGSTTYSVSWTLGVQLGLNLRSVHNFCLSFCDDAPLDEDSVYSLSLMIANYTVILPCLAVIFFALIWTCIIFKKIFIGNDSQLNRRIISLPIIMPLVTILASTLYIILRGLSQRVLELTVTSHYPNFVLLSNEFLSYILEGVGAIIYLAVLLYIHPQLRSSWIAMLKELPGVLKRKCFGKKRSNIIVHSE